MSDELDDAEGDPRFLRAFLADRDALCPQCQYNLRDLVGDRCPECGEKIVVRVGLAEPKLGAMITGLVGLSAGAGFSGLLLIYMAIQSLRGRGIGTILFWFAGPPFLIEGLLVVLWIARWRQIRSISPMKRRALVVGGWLATLINIVVFSLGVR